VRLYADRPDRRLRQLGTDLLMGVWVVVWVAVARAVHRGVLALAAPGDSVASLGRSIASSMGSAATAAGRVPVAGKALATPLSALGDAGNQVSSAGREASSSVHTLAAVLAVVLVVLPVGWALGRWLPGRLRWSREATAAGRLVSGGRSRAEPGSGASAPAPDLELLAARAVATAPLPELARLPAGTGAGWRAGDPDAVAALAGLELRRLGLRAPGGRPAGRPGR